MKDKLISIIIPTYNRAHLISRPLRAILDQSLRDFEIIVIDDGSTDNTKQIVEEFQKIDDRIRYYFTEKNSGTVAAPINLGIKKSRGKYVTFHASDDECAPTWLEEQLDIFNKPGGDAVDVVSCNILVVDSETGHKEEASKPRNKDNEYVVRTSLIHNYIFGNLVAKKVFFQKVGMYDEGIKIREDFDMWIRLFDAGYKFDFVYKPLYITYKHKGQSSHIDFYNNSKIAEYLLAKHRKIYERYPKEHSEAVRACGVLQLLAGNRLEARKSFLLAIKTYPWRLRTYFNFLSTFIGKSAVTVLFAFRQKIFVLSQAIKEKIFS